MLLRLTRVQAMVLVLVCSSRVQAQQTTATDTVRGRVISDSSPIPRAHVRLTTGQGLAKETLTDSAGRYVLVVTGDGIYELHVRAFGYTPLSVIVERGSRERVSGADIERDVQLNAIPVSLARVEVVANASVRTFDMPGDHSARWESFLSESQPLEPGDIGAIAALVPGVSRTGPDGSAISVYGQAPGQNHTVIDGATSNSASLPAEAVRSAGMVANTYDVSRGQFSGGQLSATTISGTNDWGGAVDARINAPWLDYGDLPEATSHNAKRLRLSAGGGGPVIRDRLFTYTAVDFSTVNSPQSDDLESSGDDALRRLGVSSDSARRLESIAEMLGIQSSSQALHQSVSNSSSGVSRADYAISDHQSLTIRLNARSSHSSSAGSSPLALATSRFNFRSRDVGILARLTSSTDTWANELRISNSDGSVTSSTPQTQPGGQVEIISSGAGGIFSPAVLSVGSPAFSADEHHTLLELADDIARTPAHGNHHFHAGVVTQFNTISTEDGYNRNGTFLFNNLGDLAVGRAALYTRNLGTTRGVVNRQYAATFLSDEWYPADALSLVYGLRLDGTHYGKRPPFSANTAALAVGGSSQVPTDVVISPRIGFRYDTPTRRGWTVDGGAGRFAGVLPLQPLAALWTETGTGSAALTCVGPAAPTPTWTAYAADPATIPSACVGGVTAFSSAVPSATFFDSRFRSPETWRASLGIGGNLSRTFGVSANALLLHGTHYTSAIDRNFVPVAQFTLREENDRPSYAALNRIDPATGGIAPGAARIDPMLGSVLELSSRGESWTDALTVGVDGFLASGVVSLNYTYLRSRMLVGGTPAFGVYDASTRGDPSAREWTDSPFAPRHSIQLMLSRGFAPRARITAIGRLTSGLPFTPLVASDINGDGFANDRAFVFDPVTAPDSELGRSMQLLRNTSSREVRACLGSQAGRIASTGSCTTPWSPSLDIRAQFYAIGGINSRRMMLTLTASNVTAGLDYLMHGPDKLHGWGEFPAPDPTLLKVRNFDPTRGAFNYAVNSHFGKPATAGFQRFPFRITLEARITLGSDPRYQPLLNAITAGIAGSGQSARSWLEKYVHNVPDAVLQLAATDSAALALTLRQRARLQTAADSLRPEFAAAVDSLARLVTERGPSTAARQAHLQHASQHVEQLVHIALDVTRQILTPAQFEKLPQWLLRPPSSLKLRNPVYTTEIPTGEP